MKVSPLVLIGLAATGVWWFTSRKQAGPAKTNPLYDRMAASYGEATFPGAGPGQTPG